MDVPLSCLYIGTMKNKGSAKAKAKAMIAKVVKAATTKQKQPKKQKNNNSGGGSISQKLMNSAASLGMTMAGKAIARITGVGDYQVKSNSIETNGGTIAGEVPHFGRENNSTRVRHREFIKDIAVPVNPSAFSNTTYVINPANQELFPWLSKFAENYQQYRIHGMVLIFKTTTSDYSASGGMGKVAMATNYNVRDSAYANMIELENAEFSVSGKPSMSRVHPIECASNNGLPLVRYVRDLQYDSSGGDDRLYDAGKFQFATQGLPGAAGTIIGELWMSYDIEFYKPIIGRSAPSAQYEPVVVPVFNTLEGNGNRSLHMIERSEIGGSDFGTTYAQKWDKIHRPDLWPRAGKVYSPGEARAIDGSFICRSLNRPVPDPDPANFTYPAYWHYPEHPVLSDRAELRLTRPGIWYMHLRVDNDRSSNTQPSAGNTLMSNVSYSAVPNTTDVYAQPGIEIVARKSDGTINDQGNIKVFTHNYGGGWSQPTRQDAFVRGATNDIYKAFIYRNGMNWTLMLWVSEQQVSDGATVAVRFQTANESATSYGPAFNWDNSQLYAHAYCTSAEFEVGVVSVTEQTFYKPVQVGLTTDDKATLGESIQSVLALLPKLRELGFVSN